LLGHEYKCMHLPKRTYFSRRCVAVLVASAVLERQAVQLLWFAGCRHARLGFATDVLLEDVGLEEVGLRRCQASWLASLAQ
jgi:hypothetical protein